MKEEFLYRPDIQPEKSYETTGQIVEQIDLGQEQQINDTLKNLKSKIQAIKAGLILLPKDIKGMAIIPLSGVEYVLGQINDIDSSRPEAVDVTMTFDDTAKDQVVDPNDYTNIQFIDDIVLPDSPFSDSITNVVKLEIKTNPIEDVIRKQYEYDLVTIFYDYAIKLEQCLSNYSTDFLSMVQGKDSNRINMLFNPYNLTTSSLNDANLYHLSDHIIRSQIFRELKTRLYKKMFDIDETILHVRSCKTAATLKARYHKASYKENINSLEDVDNNELLSSSRQSYDKKYKENFKSLYKYLNSSVILINECLSLFLKEAHSKNILIDKEGINL